MNEQPNVDPVKELANMKNLMRVILDNLSNKIIDMHRFAMEVEIGGFDEAMKRVIG